MPPPCHLDANIVFFWVLISPASILQGPIHSMDVFALGRLLEKVYPEGERRHGSTS